jgi:2-succinyl-6-hydroxy-2,4-cyclohexadiene-1-carboxylate synthase
MLGHGQSDAPADPQSYTMEHCQADIVDALFQVGVAPGKAVLLGYSMGGRIALYCAFSGFFRALILESASPGLADPIERESRRASDEELAMRIERDGVVAFVDYWEQLPLFASQRNLPAEKRAALRAQRLHNRALGLANSLRGVGTGVQPALHDRLLGLELPVLLIAGELDTKFCAIAQQMAQRLPQAQLHIVAGAGHTVHLEQSASFVALVEPFCRLA